jgi:hypothetical protein
VARLDPSIGTPLAIRPEVRIAVAHQVAGRILSAALAFPERAKPLRIVVAHIGPHKRPFITAMCGSLNGFILAVLPLLAGPERAFDNAFFPARPILFRSAPCRYEAVKFRVFPALVPLPHLFTADLVGA